MPRPEDSEIRDLNEPELGWLRSDDVAMIIIGIIPALLIGFESL